MLLWRDADEQSTAAALARTREVALIGLGLSISFDELVIGFTLGLLRVPAVIAIVMIAAQAFVVAQAGFRLGSRVSEASRNGAERLAGALLILLGIGFAAARLFGVQV